MKNQWYKDHIADWVLHYNIYRGRWEAAKRDHYTELFSGNKGHVLHSKSLNTLIEVINYKIYKKL